ncbi:MAG: hypothetical protein IJV11_05180 [Muribaculaceae bacterium]|nr:hypothetical protein [Muribaculaceae bacterium]
MMTIESETQQWYVLSAKDSIESLERQFDALSASRQRQSMAPVKYFLPYCVKRTTLFGAPAMRRKKLMGNYIFVRDSFAGLMEIKSAMESLWLLPHPDNTPGQHRYMTISDDEMASFMAIARAYANELPCYPIDMVDLEEGDKVQIVGGDFDGMCGTLQCSQGRSGGKVLMAVGNLFLVATPDIGPQYIRILQFGKGNRHPYRKFESHLPRAIQALRHSRGAVDGYGLTTDDIAAMTVFTGRFEALQPATVNIASQHATLMLMSYASLNDTTHAAQWRVRCVNLLPRIKSDTQRAWQLAFMFAATGDDDLRRQAQAIVDTWALTPHDRKRSLIVTTLHQFSCQ